VTDEARELLDVKDDLIEERDAEKVESRGIDSDHEVFQILVNTSERQYFKSREDNTC
jgi:hypothetical protein